MTNDRMADSSVRGTITWAHPGDPHGSPGPGPKLAPYNVFSGNVRGPKLPQPNGMCATVLSNQRWLSPILSPLSFTAGHPFYPTQFYGWFGPGVFVLTYQSSQS